MFLKLQDNAIFVADSHYNLKNKEFLVFLEQLDSKKIECSQLILMGDNFDFLSGESKYFIKQNEILIQLLNKLSLNIEIFYLEGNHDYNLQKLFPHIQVLKREEQPLLGKYKDKTLALSHGDNFINWQYDLYCSVIRNPILLKFLNMIDFGNFISKKIDSSLLGKNICHKMKDFNLLVKKRINNYKSDIIIEGHYHQGSTFEFKDKKYVNIPSLCCDKKYIKIINYEFIGVNI
ncbi:UDP-2,3-diacylglucosamine hydrolase [Poseidonibacter parvus]|uniref:UDP-2,3-diacylglucosamine hydrolase n=1 Tax=Poseidonibacter parvus TaxID=1850254 RepID=A0A1P8KKM2_9BACT|nr:metallophosphoesterase [Poseidonibacter parvus]APW65085.1 UDP-2,3-diacylglucosamine hydrolase [Poseidonibacter parvus]